jgi:hypothetical protein
MNNNKLEGMWKEAGLSLIWGTAPALSWRDWGKSHNILVRIPSLRTEIWTLNLPNPKELCYLLKSGVWSEYRLFALDNQKLYNKRSVTT